VIDPLRTARAEIAALPAVATITAGRIRRGDPAPGDAQGAGKYQAFVVLVRLDTSRDARLARLEVPIAARCYGRDREEAAALWGAISDGLNNRGPRILDGVLVHRTFAPSDGGDAEDPDTKQPMVAGLIRYHVATAAVA
jgi:hypothetical protein